MDDDLPEFDRLAAIGRLVYYDQRGCGASGRETAASWEDHVSDLDRLVRHLGVGRVNLAGPSWGAYLALLYAVRHPDQVRALVPSSPPAWEWGDLWTSPEEQWERLSPAARESIVRKARAAAAFGLLSRNDGDNGQRSRHSGPWSDPVIYGVDSALAERLTDVCDGGGSWMLTLKQRPGTEALRALDIPVLIFEGEKDRIKAGLELAGLLPRATHVTIAEAGRDPWSDDPDRFFGEANRFLAAQ